MALPGVALRRAGLWISLWGKLAALPMASAGYHQDGLFQTKNLYGLWLYEVNMMSSARHGP